MFEQYEDIMTVNELAEALRIGTSQAYKLLKTRKIRGFKEGKDWKIPRSALVEYVLYNSGIFK